MAGRKTRDSARYSVRRAVALWFGVSGLIWLGIALIAARL
jgi:hypothetical protein